MNFKGFSLLEVLIAMTVFAIFLASYVISQGQNLSDSARLQEDIILRRLAEDIINQIILAPPELTGAITLVPVTKKFEGEYQDYEYTIKYKKIELPNFFEFQEEKGNTALKQTIRQTIYQGIKENIERILWQVAVTVKNTQNSSDYVISTWIKKPKEYVSIRL